METPWDLVLELSREPFEIKQICQWLKCAPRWEEQSINRVYHGKSPGSQVIVADVINSWRIMETRRDLVLELSREPFEIEHISQWLKCAPRWEGLSINRVFHCNTPGYQVIVADVTNGCCVMFNTLGLCTWITSRAIWDRPHISMAEMFASMRGTIY